MSGQGSSVVVDVHDHSVLVVGLLVEVVGLLTVAGRLLSGVHIHCVVVEGDSVVNKLARSTSMESISPPSIPVFFFLHPADAGQSHVRSFCKKNY